MTFSKLFTKLQILLKFDSILGSIHTDDIVKTINGVIVVYELYHILSKITSIRFCSKAILKYSNCKNIRGGVLKYLFCILFREECILIYKALDLKKVKPQTRHAFSYLT